MGASISFLKLQPAVIVENKRTMGNMGRYCSQEYCFWKSVHWGIPKPHDVFPPQNFCKCFLKTLDF